MLVTIVCLVTVLTSSGSQSQPQRVEINLSLAEAEGLAEVHRLDPHSQEFNRWACAHLTEVAQASQE